MKDELSRHCGARRSVLSKTAHEFLQGLFGPADISGTPKIIPGLIEEEQGVDALKSHFIEYPQDVLGPIEFGPNAEPMPEDGNRLITSGEFLDKIHKNEFATQDDLIDYIYDEVDRLCWRGDDGLAVINEILEKVDLDQLPTAAMRSLLTTTYPAKDRLPERPNFFNRVKLKIGQIRGVDAAEQILRWLE